jgi:hypothetical protein
VTGAEGSGFASVAGSIFATGEGEAAFVVCATAGAFGVTTIGLTLAAEDAIGARVALCVVAIGAFAAVVVATGLASGAATAPLGEATVDAVLGADAMADVLTTGVAVAAGFAALGVAVAAGFAALGVAVAAGFAALGVAVAAGFVALGVAVTFAAPPAVLAGWAAAGAAVTLDAVRAASLFASGAFPVLTAGGVGRATAGVTVAGGSFATVGAGASAAVTGGGRTDSATLKTGVSFVPSTRIPDWHCLHLIVTTRPLTLRSKTSSAMLNVLWQAAHVMGNGIRGLAYTDRLSVPQICGPIARLSRQAGVQTFSGSPTSHRRTRGLRLGYAAS